MMDRGIGAAVIMIFIAAAMLFVLTLPSYFSETHRILLSLVILVGGAVFLGAVLKG